MHCREAFVLVANHEQDRDLSAFLLTPEGSEVEAHISNCRCGMCLRSLERIRAAGVRGSLRVIPGRERGTG